jgi:hypothetical protein
MSEAVESSRSVFNEANTIPGVLSANRKLSRNGFVGSWHAFKPKPLKLAHMGQCPHKR